MLFTLKKPKSKRFFHLKYEGFKPSGKNRFDQLGKSLNSFWRAILAYFAVKVHKTALLILKVLKLILNIPGVLKTYLVRRLIWSRGRLGRPVATAIVTLVSLAVFGIGEFLSGLNLVVVRSFPEDYLSSNIDMLPKKEIALTTIPDIRKRTEAVSYTVQGGDTLFGIGEKFKVSVDALKYVNSLTDYTVLKVGQSITIPPASGLVHTVKSGDTLTSIASKYSVAPQAIADFNYLLSTTKLTVGTDLVIPGAKVPEPVVPVYTLPTAPTGNYAQATPSKGFCVWPSTVRIITQYFSWYHNGIDIATPWSGGMPPLFACTSGRVIRAGWDPYGLGLHVRIDHGNGYETIYGHMSRLDVGYGQKVSRGEMLGLMGNTGRSTGPHVHYMVKFNGVAQNPLSYTN